MTVYSFDVFDTCVARSFAYPRDLFYALGLRVAPSQFGPEEAQRFAARFQQRRIQAEKVACRRGGFGQQATLSEVYARFRPPRGLALKAQELVEVEVALERESLYAIPEMLARLWQLRGAGHRIIFISDMYLPAAVLGPILNELGVKLPDESLYVSCDAGCSKRDGKLFQHVLRAEGLQPTQLIHHGDNLLADVQMARKCGIEAHHEDAGLLTAHERQRAGHHRRRQLPRPPAASFLAGFSRRLRLALRGEDNHIEEPLDALLQGTIVPFLLAYVSWVLEDVRKRGIQRLYFVARDGEVLLRVAELLQGNHGHIDLRYLYGSRRAWIAPSILPDDDQWKAAVAAVGQSRTRKALLTRLGLNANDRAFVRQSLANPESDWERELSASDALQFLDSLMASKQVRARIDASTASLRQTALAYFEQEGLFDGSRWALVDAGWSLNCQAALGRILGSKDSDFDSPTGYYIALADDHVPVSQAGLAMPFVPTPGSLFARRRVVVEHAFLPATHASTRGYTRGAECITPQLGPETRAANELGYMQRLHKTATVAAQLATSDRSIAHALTVHAGAIAANAAHVLQQPRADDARALAALTAAPDTHHEADTVRSLCRRLRVGDLASVVREGIAPGTVPRKALPVWPEGSAAISPTGIRSTLGMLSACASLKRRLSEHEGQTSS